MQIANNNLLSEDVVLPFMIESSSLSGRFVRLGTSIHNILSGHRYPEIVSKLLGELVVLSAMVGTMLKFNGIFSIQIQGSGAVPFLASDYTSAGDLRGYAKIKDKKILKQIDINKLEQDGIESLFGKGYVVITMESAGERPYQAIIPLEGSSLTECITGYFRKSDQLDTILEVRVDKINNKWRAGGIVVQKIAHEGGRKVDIPNKNKTQEEKEGAWNTAAILLRTITKKELLDKKLSPEDLLYRLFNEEGIRVFDSVRVQAKCRCSRERMSAALSGIPREELESLKKNGKIEMSCHFCGRKEFFSDDEF